MVIGRRINKYYRKYWYLFLLGALFLATVDISQLFIPLIMGDFVGALTSNSDPDFYSFGLVWSGSWFEFNVGYILLAIGVIGFVITFGRIGWRLTLSRVGFLIECDLREELFNHTEGLPVSWFAKEKVGGLMAYFTNDLEDISSSFSQGMLYLIDATVLGLSSLAFMFYTHWVLALLCLAPLIAMGVSGYLIMKGETNLWAKSQQAFQNMSDMAQESISGLSVIKAFVREGREMQRFADSNGKLKIANIKYFHFSQLYGNCWINILIYSTVVIILAVGAYFAVTPDLVFPGIAAFSDTNTAAAMLTKFFGYYSSMIWPLMALTLLIDLGSRGKASLNRVSRILDTDSDLKDSPSLYSGKVQGDIEYRHLTFAYPDDTDSPVLKDISFKVKAGEGIGIVGRTGSGKSSLLTLLLKLYNVPRGMVFIDGRDINDWYGKALRTHMGFVSQDAFLFSETIAGNIAFGHKGATADEIYNAAKFADVDENIRELPEGYDTLVGERGKAVSGGQRQRISMSRAVIRDPAVLVLDDSVSAVDAITEKDILANIKEKRRGKTTFVISSRLSAVENLDAIIVLDHGSLAGFGTHEELLKDCPVYRKLYDLQMLQKELA